MIFISKFLTTILAIIYRLCNIKHILPVAPIASKSCSQYGSDNLRSPVRDHSALRPVVVAKVVPPEAKTPSNEYIRI